MELDSRQRQYLKGLAHHLKPIVHLGKDGLTPSLLKQIDEALLQHELIKVKVAAEDREARDAMIQDIADRAGAALVQRIGHTAVLDRPSTDKRQIVLPRA